MLHDLSLYLIRPEPMFPLPDFTKPYIPPKPVTLKPLVYDDGFGGMVVVYFPPGDREYEPWELEKMKAVAESFGFKFSPMPQT